LKNLSFAVIANIKTLSQLPYTPDNPSCSEIFRFAICVKGYLNPAIVFYPVKTFFHTFLPSL